jgi:GxxExxY protein
MPVIPRNPVQCISQKEFSDIAYAVMAKVFEVHRDLGRLFDEKIYQREIAGRLGNAECEFPIDVTFDTFSKTFRLDLLVDGRAIFELKAAEAIVPRHRAQSGMTVGELSVARMYNCWLLTWPFNSVHSRPNTLNISNST